MSNVVASSIVSENVISRGKKRSLPLASLRVSSLSDGQ